MVRGFLDRRSWGAANSRSIQSDASANVLTPAGAITDLGTGWRAGWTKSKGVYPLGKMGEVGEVVEAVLYLESLANRLTPAAAPHHHDPPGCEGERL